MMKKLFTFILTIVSLTYSYSQIKENKKEAISEYIECSYLFYNSGVKSIDELDFIDNECFISYFKDGFKVKSMSPIENNISKVDTFIYDTDGNLIKQYYLRFNSQNKLIKIDSTINEFKNGIKISTHHHLGGQVLKGEYYFSNDTTFEKVYIDDVYQSTSFTYYNREENVIVEPRPGRKCSSNIYTLLNAHGKPKKIEWLDTTTEQMSSFTEYKYDNFQRLIVKKNFKDDFNTPRSITVYKFDEECPIRKEILTSFQK